MGYWSRVMAQAIRIMDATDKISGEEAYLIARRDVDFGLDYLSERGV